jgi:hypothetical protein
MGGSRAPLVFYVGVPGNPSMAFPVSSLPTNMHSFIAGTAAHQALWQRMEAMIRSLAELGQRIVGMLSFPDTLTGASGHVCVCAVLP